MQSYLPLETDLAERQEELANQYGFTCCCERCEREARWAAEEEEKEKEEEKEEEGEVGAGAGPAGGGGAGDDGEGGTAAKDPGQGKGEEEKPVDQQRSGAGKEGLEADEEEAIGESNGRGRPPLDLSLHHLPP